ncbi:MAG: hypothetical protein WCR29_04520, partial [Bacteroidales bacterium]
MIEFDILKFLGLDRAKSIDSENEKLLDDEFVILSEVKEKGFGIDSVYFNTDEIGNNFPAIFLKKVISFDEETLQLIADTHKKIWNYKKILFLYVYSDFEIRIYNCTERPLIKTKEDFNYEKGLQDIEIKKYNFSDKKQ